MLLGRTRRLPGCLLTKLANKFDLRALLPTWKNSPLASSTLAPSLSARAAAAAFLQQGSHRAIRCRVSHRMKARAGHTTKIGTRVNTYFLELKTEMVKEQLGHIRTLWQTPNESSVPTLQVCPTQAFSLWPNTPPYSESANIVPA